MKKYNIQNYIRYKNDMTYAIAKVEGKFWDEYTRDELIMVGYKHLIDCHCVLRIYKKNENIINHKFPVYSKLDASNKIIAKHVKCNNCEAVHYVHTCPLLPANVMYAGCVFMCSELAWLEFYCIIYKAYKLLVNRCACEHCKSNIDMPSYGLIFISLNCSSEAG